MLPGVATPVGSGVWGAPQGKSAAHIDLSPQPLARARTKRSGASYWVAMAEGWSKTIAKLLPSEAKSRSTGGVARKPLCGTFIGAVVGSRAERTAGAGPRGADRRGGNESINQTHDATPMRGTETAERGSWLR